MDWKRWQVELEIASYEANTFILEKTDDKQTTEPYTFQGVMPLVMRLQILILSFPISRSV